MVGVRRPRPTRLLVAPLIPLAYIASLQGLRVEEQGPLRAVVHVEGTLGAWRGPRLEFEFRANSRFESHNGRKSSDWQTSGVSDPDIPGPSSFPAAGAGDGQASRLHGPTVDGIPRTVLKFSDDHNRRPARDARVRNRQPDFCS